MQSLTQKSRRVVRPRSSVLGLGAIWLSSTGLFVLLASVLFGAQPSDGYSGISQQKGFDTCTAPAQSFMDTWWAQSPYWNIGIYIGGANRACSQPNLSAQWVSDNRLWGMLPIWVGPQMPKPECQQHTAWNANISLDPATAHNQGRSEAAAAYSAAGNLGMDRPGMPIIYDLEAYGGGTKALSTCIAAAKAFIDGWVEWLHVSPAQKAGVYGSQCASYLRELRSIDHVPDFIWFAWWNGNPDPYNTSSSCPIGASDWANHQRHKQYAGNVTETYGGKSRLIDRDCSDGPVYLDHDRLGIAVCF